jgi:hypothetical protein
VFVNVVVVVVTVLIPSDSRIFHIVCVIAVVAAGAVVNRNTANAHAGWDAASKAVTIYVVA